MQAGFGAYRKSFFLELGGFDDLYLPGTVEDCDICFRFWRGTGPKKKHDGRLPSGWPPC
jgi:hypothetical protein